MYYNSYNRKDKLSAGEADNQTHRDMVTPSELRDRAALHPNVAPYLIKSIK